PRRSRWFRRAEGGAGAKGPAVCSNSSRDVAVLEQRLRQHLPLVIRQRRRRVGRHDNEARSPPGCLLAGPVPGIVREEDGAERIGLALARLPEVLERRLM